MKRYVLNIDRLYTGETANALVLKQVDEDFPILLPSVPPDVDDLIGWIKKCKKIQPTFIPPSLRLTRERLNQCIVEFNLNLQTKFKDSGHEELYMMDDTWGMKPNAREEAYGKTYMHSLNGKSDEGQNVSQMNVIFPYGKTTQKSQYASYEQVKSPLVVDDLLEHARLITIQGRVSYEKCVQAVAQVGNNLYVMSPNVDIGVSEQPELFGNGLAVVNSYLERPFHFPHSMTLFQPGQQNYIHSVLADRCRNCGYKQIDMGSECPECQSTDIARDEFRKWYELHSRRTIVTFSDDYGGNVSQLKCLGTGSYQIELATYSPTGLVIGNLPVIPFTSDTYRQIRSGQDVVNRYEESGYVFDNSIADVGDSFADVGFMFNLYDTFITGQDRILKMTIPRDADFNHLTFAFEWEIVKAEGLLGDMETTIEVKDLGNIVEEGTWKGEYFKDLDNSSVEPHEMTIAVRIHYDVDFGRRNVEKGYRDKLRESGVIIRNIRVENGADVPVRLTFGSYVNEPGISEEEREIRYNQFWEVSRYIRDLAYQTVVETSMKNVHSSGVRYLNNYSSGDMYGDMFVTKSVLDPRYDMNFRGDNSPFWAEGRNYLGMGSCSNQLWLTYSPLKIDLGNGDKAKTFNENPESELKYQMVEVVKNINRFESSIKHKSNVFSVVVENSNLAKSGKDESMMTDGEKALERFKQNLRESVIQFVRNACSDIVPVHTQLFDVQFT